MESDDRLECHGHGVWSLHLDVMLRRRRIMMANVSALSGGGDPLSLTTWSTTNKNANPVLSNGNLTATSPGGSTFYAGRSDSFVALGVKLYHEIKINIEPGGSNHAGSGFGNSSMSLADNAYLGSDVFGFGYYQDGNVYLSSGVVHTLVPFAQGDIICWALTGATNGWARLNGGSWMPSGDPSAGTGGFGDLSGFGNLCPAYTVLGTGQITANFGSTFTFSVPAGFAGYP